MRIRLTLTRLLPLGLLGCCVAATAGVAPGPSVNPNNEELTLVFADEFEGSRLDPAVWESQAYDKGLSRDTARGPDNLEVRDGELRLHLRKEARPAGKRTSTWTAGYVYTREAMPNNVLIEARFKPGSAPGVNNAFWLACVTTERSGIRDRYEIDVVETRRDMREGGVHGRGHLAWHDWKTYAYALNAKGESDHVAQGIHVEHTWDEFHTWALWYGEHEMIYYLDGREVWRGQTHPRYHDQYRSGVGKFPRWFPDFEKEAYGKFGQDDWSYFGGYAGDKMNLVFSNLPWPETWTPLSESAHGTYMAVDYVRVYRPARLMNAQPSQHALVAAPLTLMPGEQQRVELATSAPLATDGQFPSYFSFKATLSAGAKLVALFDAANEAVFSVAGEADGGLRAGFAREVSTTTAFPANRKREPWIAPGREMIWIGRYTPPHESGGRAGLSLCVFPANEAPADEPFYHANVDEDGNTSLNNGWHLNAREHSSASTVQSLLVRNAGSGALKVGDLKFGPSYRSVLAKPSASVSSVERELAGLNLIYRG